MLGGSYLPHVLSKLSNHMVLAEGACVYPERSEGRGALETSYCVLLRA